jgi:hypothetical protein
MATAAAPPGPVAGASRVVFRTPLTPRLLSLVGVLVIGGTGIAMMVLAVVCLFARQEAIALLIAALAVFMAGLTGHVARDLRGKWGLRVVLDADRVTLDLPAGRSLIHRPPARHLDLPYADIEAIETRLEAYGTLGMESMQRAYVLRRRGGELIFLFEDRALATLLASSFFPRIAAEIAARAQVPVRDLGMVEGKGGFLAVWGTSAPDWAAPSLPLARQLRLWRHAAFTGALAIGVVIIAVVVRLLSGPLW